jgi:PAS domain S-box-containing protein
MVLVDVSANKAAEEELHQIRVDLDRAQEVGQTGSWRLDVVRSVLSWSAENHRIFGVPAGTPLSYETFLGIVHPDDRQYVDAQWQAALAGRPYDIEHRLMVDGQVKWVREKAYLEFDAEGRLLGGFGITQDITENKHMEASLRQSNETLEQRVTERTKLAEARASQLQTLAVELIEAEERERRRMAELLHDDLQQILACARMQLQAACEVLPPEPLLAHVERMLADSIAKSRHLSHELSPVVLYQAGLVVALQWLARQMQEQFELRVELESQTAQPVASEPLMLFIFRAVQELLFNVVKHAGVKSARVAIRDTDGGLSVAVSDQGRGFNPDILETFTVPTGLGLLSLKERASYIGGRLAIDSAPGRGSRFTLTVPFSLDRADGAQRPAPAAAAQADTPAGEAVCRVAGSTRVLFADDHQVMRKGLVKLIAGQPGIQVVGEAVDGRQAIEKVRQLMPDVVVMDVTMPEMDGIEATRRIKAEWPEVRVIGLSMHVDEQIALAMRQAGAEAFVSKTVSSADLLKAIYGISCHAREAGG